MSIIPREKRFRALVDSFAFIDLTHSEKVAKNMV